MNTKHLALALAAGTLATVIAAGTASALASSAEAGKLRLIDTAYGKVVADAKGNALYRFEKDAPGVSRCSDQQCVTAWPAALADSGTSADTAITAKLGTIPSVQGPSKGKKQLTINGLPVYYFSKDTVPGDTKGQGVAPGGPGTSWYLMSANGVPVAKAP